MTTTCFEFRSLALAALLLATACGEASPTPGDPGVQVISGAGQSDTIEAFLPEAIEFEVRDADGWIADGVPVTVSGCAAGCTGLVRLAGTEDPYTVQVTTPTDADGRVRIEVRLYGIAREGAIALSVPSLDLAGSAPVTVLPGQAVGVAVTPHDTTVHPGASYLVTAATYDRYDNHRADPVTIESGTPSTVTVSGTGSVGAVTFGRGRVLATSGVFKDSAYVSVVPTGNLVAAVYKLPSHFATLDLDGTGYLERAETGVFGGGAPSWSPDGQKIAFHYYGSAASGSLWLWSAAGGSVKLIADHPASFNEEHFPRFSHDGDWIYFQGLTFSTQWGEIWRIHPDGSGLERVGTPGGPSGGESFPDPSPDGTRVALATDRGQPDSAKRIVVRTIATGEDLDLGVRGTYPRWSPSGGDIAFLRAAGPGTPEALTLIKPDGSDVRVLLARAGDYSFHGIEWSPDGEWILTDADGRLTLLRVATGLKLPLLSSENFLFYPSWR